jgi:hypothetical protein
MFPFTLLTQASSVGGGGAVSAVGTINAEQARKNILAITPLRPNLLCMVFLLPGFEEVSGLYSLRRSEMFIAMEAH